MWMDNMEDSPVEHPECTQSGNACSVVWHRDPPAMVVLTLFLRSPTLFGSAAGNSIPLPPLPLDTTQEAVLASGIQLGPAADL